MYCTLNSEHLSRRLHLQSFRMRSSGVVFRNFNDYSHGQLPRAMRVAKFDNSHTFESM